jgi:hypothetical protein
MNRTNKRNWLRPAGRIVCVVLAALSLAGCVIYPAGGYYYRPYPYHYWR